jgi:hypothetical protein
MSKSGPWNTIGWPSPWTLAYSQRTLQSESFQHLRGGGKSLVSTVSESGRLQYLWLGGAVRPIFEDIV